MTYDEWSDDMEFPKILQHDVNVTFPINPCQEVWVLFGDDIEGPVCNGVQVVLQLLGEGVGQAREPAHSHAHGQVLPLDV